MTPLLPVSAAPFAPRASASTEKSGVSTTEKEQRRQNRVKKRQLNNVLQHQRYLTEILSSPNAIWTLTSIMLPKTPEANFKRVAHNPLVEAIMNYEIIHIEDTIGTLIEHHKKVYCVEVANTCDGGQRCKKLHEEFVQAINKFVLHTKLSALEGLEEGGSGELLNGESEKLKSRILSLMEHPHRRVGDVTQQTSVFPKDNAWPEPDIPNYGVGMPLFEMGGPMPGVYGYACLYYTLDDSSFSAVM
ncbi:hypothetical protein CEP52_017721 [Fusarium oligoseptatum]|uniref:Uncharacterized protein n=1 Tax=Fusarium oligoseptatum TaxID=2604345 RepID=A0A428RIQ5_9HYPO|nr:hypothetical protein CEP52_017721 [Fusarium oligoseptatum]